MGKAYFCGNFRAVVWEFIRIITCSIERNIILIRHSGDCRGIRRSVKNIMRLRLDPQGFAQDDGGVEHITKAAASFRNGRFAFRLFGYEPFNSSRYS